MGGKYFFCTDTDRDSQDFICFQPTLNAQREKQANLCPKLKAAVQIYTRV